MRYDSSPFYHPATAASVQVNVITSQDSLWEEAELMCAVAGLTAHRCDPFHIWSLWEDASPLIIDKDTALSLNRHFARRHKVWLLEDIHHDNQDTLPVHLDWLPVVSPEGVGNFAAQCTVSHPHGGSPTPVKRASMIAVLGMHGGAGTTTIAIALANYFSRLGPSILMSTPAPWAGEFMLGLTRGIAADNHRVINFNELMEMSSPTHLQFHYSRRLSYATHTPKQKLVTQLASHGATIVIDAGTWNQSPEQDTLLRQCTQYVTVSKARALGAMNLRQWKSQHSNTTPYANLINGSYNAGLSPQHFRHLSTTKDLFHFPWSVRMFHSANSGKVVIPTRMVKKISPLGKTLSSTVPS